MSIDRTIWTQLFYLCNMVGSFYQRMFMLFTGVVIMFNICSASLNDILRFSVDKETTNDKKEIVLKNFVQAGSPDQLIDIEENSIEVEEKEEKTDTKLFFFQSGFRDTGASIFEDLNGRSKPNSLRLTYSLLALFILFENFRI